MRLKLLAALLAAGLVAVLSPGIASANHSWGGYHWARTSNPFTLKLSDNVTSTWDSSLASTSSDWTASSVLNTTIVPGSANPRNCKAPLGQVSVCNAAYGNNGWLGIASISITGGTHITKGSVRLNDTYFNTPQYNTSEWRNLVTCQEVGHTLGLDHQDETFDNPNLGTCMDYTNDPSTNQHPNNHDYDQLVAIYSHLDTSTTVGANAVPGAPGATAGNSPDGWGHSVAGSRASGHSTYVRDLGEGNLVVTFVTWA
ncbi:MAG: hypothetical protein LH645_03065 [Actinomycetia bacterium]|nr:hypothetical protein [Actinomycetes bacterium]